MTRSARPFPYWISGPVWAFLAIGAAAATVVLVSDRFGFRPNPWSALLLSGPHLIVAALFLLQDWRWHRQDRGDR